MKLRDCFVAIAIAFTGFVPLANSIPYPDRVGICYQFEGNSQKLIQPCVISSGFGAGGHYRILHWIDGEKTSIIMSNYCPEENFDQAGFCGYTVDEQEATPYYRNAFMQRTQLDTSETISCLQVINTEDSVCYRFN